MKKDIEKNIETAEIEMTENQQTSVLTTAQVVSTFSWAIKADNPGIELR